MQNFKRSMTPIFLVLVAIVLAGCSEQGLPLVPVSGKVTFDGDTCPDQGYVTFQPIEVAEGLPKRPGSGIFSEDGVYEITSFKKGDGILPGKYLVAVSCDSGQPDFRSPTAFEDITNIGPGYKPTEIVVEKDSDPITLDIDVPLKKKK